MTRSPLPEITLTCGDGHQFTTQAAGGGTVRCKECGKSKHVPVDRPRTAKEAAAYTTPGAGDHQDQAPALETDPGRELADRWRGESDWAEKITFLSGRDQDECPECSGPLHWEPRRTLTYCRECKQVDLPTVITEHYARQASQRSEVAVRQHTDPVAEKTARAQLRGRVIQTEQWADRWLETIGDPAAYDGNQWKESAQEFTAALRGWLPEIRNAETEDELAEIKQAIIRELINSEPGKELYAEYKQMLNRVEQQERQQEARDRAEYAAEQRALAEQQERIAAERQAMEARQQKAITGGTQSRATPPSGYLASAVVISQFVQSITANYEQKAKDLKEKGTCEFNHRGQVVATRLFGVPARNWRGEMSGLAVANTPQHRACEKHYAEAEKWLNGAGYTDVAYWDLPIQQTEQTGSDYGF